MRFFPMAAGSCEDGDDDDVVGGDVVAVTSSLV
jgi:hypothetical protein